MEVGNDDSLYDAFCAESELDDMASELDDVSNNEQAPASYGLLRGSGRGSLRNGGGVGAHDDDTNTGPEPQWQHLDADAGVSSWPRPPVPAIHPNVQPIIFQQFDVDFVIDDLKPVVRIYGVTDQGNSVCAFVTGFEPYFYIEAPPGFTSLDIPCFKDELQRRVNAEGTKQHEVTHVVMEKKLNIWQYQFQQQTTFLKIYVQLPNSIAQCRSILEKQSFAVNGKSVGNCTTFESNLLFPLRFMIDSGISGGTWVEAPARKYTLVKKAQKVTTAQIEIQMHYENLINHPPEGDFARLAPFRILSVDIECQNRKGKFPDPEHDSVIQIASRVTCLGSTTAAVNNILTLKECSPIIGAEVMSFERETDLLLKWQKLLRLTDPDVIIGYNICNFDLPYLVNRARALQIDGEFEFWGRIRSSRLKMRDSQFSSKAYGTHEYKEISVEGRVQFDLMLSIQRDHKLSSYSLNSVSAHFLGEQKEDVHHSCITDLQNGNPETRRRLAVYCIKDAYLPQRLIDRLMYMYNYMEMARVTGVPFSYLLTKGQSIKVYSQLLRKARKKGFVIPSVKPAGQGQGVAYEGATVLEACQGYYDSPVATLDFASLYPSIMMAHNLCYTTLVPKDKVGMLSPMDVEVSPCGNTFVKASVLKGLLPEVLEELLAARKRAKADLKKATDPFVRAVLDGRQLALKVSANSVYGFTGATVGKLPCLEISSSVTAYGREMIHHTKELVLSLYNKEKGFEADCVVIYGDTDSVMVNFNVPSIQRSMELGQQAADEITKTFPPPVKLEFEKVYCPYLLMSKKRYAGLLWTNPEKHDKMDTKGIESVRRDNCLLVRRVVTTSLEKLLIDRDIQGALKFVKQTISDLLMNRLDLSELVVSKGLSRDAGDYETKIAHVELAKKMHKRDPATAPGVGDRVPYVIIKAAKGAKAYEKAEDPIFALEHNLPIDFQHYVDHHLSQPLLRIFEPILKSRVKELLCGEHTRSIIVSTPSAASGGIMKFAKTKPKCLGCKAPLDKGLTVLCQHCEPNKAQVYLTHLEQVNDLEDAFGRLWTQCQTCQGSLLQDVLCTNRDCPIFYRRKKVRKDLGDAEKNLAKLNE